MKNIFFILLGLGLHCNAQMYINKVTSYNPLMGHTTSNGMNLNPLNSINEIWQYFLA